MVTLRTGESDRGGAAKSLLEGRNVACELADENANAYGGAPLAMPVRLLVREEQLEEAKQALSQLGPELPPDFYGAASEARNQNESEQLTKELRELQHRQGWIMLLAIVTIFLTAYLIVELSRRSSSPWTTVSQAIRQYDYPRALEVAKALSTQHPNDYYAHEYLGDIYAAMGNLANAEIEYKWAQQLAPPAVLRAKLDEIQRRRGSAPTPLSTISPWP